MGIVSPPGQAKLDWQIFAELAAKMGYAKQLPWKSAEDVFTEISKVTPSYGGMNYARLNRPEALHWPCPTAEHPGTPILHIGSSLTLTGSGFSPRLNSSGRQRYLTQSTPTSSLQGAVSGTGIPGP